MKISIKVGMIVLIMLFLMSCSKEKIVEDYEENIRSCVAEGRAGCKELFDPRAPEECAKIGDECYYVLARTEGSQHCSYIKNIELQDKCNMENAPMLAPGGAT